MPSSRKAGSSSKRKGSKVEDNGVKKKSSKKKEAKEAPKKIIASKNGGAAADDDSSSGGSVSRVPPFDGRTRAELNKDELNSLNAYFMRKNRMRHVLEKKAQDFASILGGSVLLVIETGGGAHRDGRRYITGSGRFGGQFMKANVDEVMEHGDMTWSEAKGVNVMEFLEAMSGGARHSAAIASDVKRSEDGRRSKKKKKGKKQGKKASKSKKKTQQKPVESESESSSDSTPDDDEGSGDGDTEMSSS
jgi:hypothetical protein